jgi:GNAT superfamily N-acetyltransferase
VDVGIIHACDHSLFILFAIAGIALSGKMFQMLTAHDWFGPLNHSTHYRNTSNETTMTSLLRTNSDHKDFILLVKYLDADLAQRDGKDHSFYAQYNKIDAIRHAVIAYDDNRPVGCGAMKELTQGTMEIKRMYTSPEQRGKGIATRVLKELEDWARELGYGKCVLETGKRQPEAIDLYKRNNYIPIPNYGQYVGIENSLCFEKILQ